MKRMKVVQQLSHGVLVLLEVCFSHENPPVFFHGNDIQSFVCIEVTTSKSDTVKSTTSSSATSSREV